MNPKTLLLRQVHLCFIQNGKITSQVFRPTPKDENAISVYNGDLISAEDSYQHFCSQPDCRSSGVMALSKGECDLQELPVTEDGVPFPAHCLIRFEGFTKSQIEKKAKYLKGFAEKRGWLYVVVVGDE